MKGWIGIDLDGTLAEYNDWKGHTHIGAPVPAMLALVRHLVSIGVEVRIFTARVCSLQPIGIAESARVAIQDWLESNGLPRLTVTSEKDYMMIELWDDRVVKIEQNTGRILSVDVATMEGGV